MAEIVAAFGVPHATWGEEVAAAVVLREAVTEADLLAYCREHLADYKRPKQIHLVETIPRTVPYLAPPAGVAVGDVCAAPSSVSSS